MSPLPEEFLQHLRSQGYNSRSNKHSNALATAIVFDLLERCDPLAAKAKQGDVVFDLNFDLHVKTATWNVDLVLGKPAVSQVPVDQAITRSAPSTVEIAIELKSIMTRHHNNAKNRKRDLEAHHEHVHRYDKRTIAGGVFVINGAIQFQSSLRQEPNLHARGSATGVRALVAHCVSEMRNVAERNSVDDDGMDAKCVLVLDMDNIDLKRTKYESRPPAPQTGDPLHYDSFLQRICNQYRQRFA